MATPPASGRKLFISYRRDDQPDFVRLLRTYFALSFGKENVFMDSHNISAGAQWREVITRRIRWCDAMVVIVGPKWAQTIRERAIEEFDPVREEIVLALAEKKVIIPVRIKNAPELKAEQLHYQVREMLNYNVVELPDVADSESEIERLMSSIDRTLAEREDLAKEAQKLDEFPPAAGLALGYFVNFVRPVIQRLTAQNDDRDRFVYGIDVRDRATPPATIHKFGWELKDRVDLRLHIVIPHRAALLKPRFLEAIKQNLRQASIQSDSTARAFVVDAWQTNDRGFQLIDFPNTLTVLEDWVERRLADKGQNPSSAEWRRIETEELRRFETVLRWWVDGTSQAANFRDRVQIVRFPGAEPEFDWVESAWRASGALQE